MPHNKSDRSPLVATMSRTKLSRNTVIAIISIILTACIIYTSVRSYHGVMNETVPIVANKIHTRFAELTSSLDLYQSASGVITPDIKDLLKGYGEDLYTLVSGDPRFSGEVSGLIRQHGEDLRMLSPTYQVLLFCSTYQAKCKDMLSFIVNDLSSKLF